MSDIKINEILSQIRSISNQVQPNIETHSENNEVPSFSTLLKSSVDKVNDQQKLSSDLRTRFEQGDASVELSRVMVEAQKARVSFEAVKQVRNQLVTAYQEVMRMPV